MLDRRIIGALVLAAALPAALRAQSDEVTSGKAWLPPSAAESVSHTETATATPPPDVPAPQPAARPDKAAAASEADSPSPPPAATTTASAGAAPQSSPPAKDAKPDASPSAAPATPAAAPANAAASATPQVPAEPPAKKLFGAIRVAAPMPPKSYGTYAKGCLAGAEALPVDGPAWKAMRLSRNRNWAHPKLVALVERFANEMKTEEHWPGLLVGDMSQPRGGPMLTGHKSHQVGLDADIWFKPMPDGDLPVEARETFEPLLLAEENGTQVIAANWNDGFARLVKRAASYPEVERIFVHPAIKKKFCEWAGDDKKWLAKVRPMWLHNYHFHVRIACPPDSAGCEKQVATTGEDGCGKELDDWIKLVSRPPKPPAPDAKPPPPPQPPHEIALNDLPSVCRQVLAADPGGTVVPVVAATTPAAGAKSAKHATSTQHASAKKSEQKKTASGQ